MLETILVEDAVENGGILFQGFDDVDGGVFDDFGVLSFVVFEVVESDVIDHLFGAGVEFVEPLVEHRSQVAQQVDLFFRVAQSDQSFFQSGLLGEVLKYYIRWLGSDRDIKYYFLNW